MQFLKRKKIDHDTRHVQSADAIHIPTKLQSLGKAIASDLIQKKALMGVFDEGCMGMFNAIIPDVLLHATGVFKERLSQSALYHETMQISQSEARAVFRWLERAGRQHRFNFRRFKSVVQFGLRRGLYTRRSCLGIEMYI